MEKSLSLWITRGSFHISKNDDGHTGCYLDDIIVWGRDWSVHMVRLRNNFGKLKTAGVGYPLVNVYLVLNVLRIWDM